MKIQLLTIGNELLNGKIQDKNSYWLAQFCHQRNWDFLKNHTIPDDESAFMLALGEAWKDADLVITSGGLGPTPDDLTKDLAAKFFGKKLVHSEEALAIVEKNYGKSERVYNPDLRYSHIPEDFEAIYNAVGYAPGLFYTDGKKMLAILPGVPSEFRRMISEEVHPRAVSFFPRERELSQHVILRTWRAPEAKIFNSIAPTLWDQLAVFGEVSSLPMSMGVDIGVKIKAPNQEQLQNMEKQIVDAANAAGLKEYIWHVGQESLEEVIVKEAMKKKITLGFAESCTGGLCASRITDVTGSSGVFHGSIVSYSNDVKSGVLKVKESTLEKYGAVSSETAWEMAQGARQALGVDLVVTTTGIAGPGGGSEEKPVGTIGIGYSSERHCAGDLFHFTARDRQEMKLVFSQAALFTMLEQIRLWEA